LNDDLWKNPFNAEYEEFVSSVRDLLAPIITDIRRFGLKVLHLRKYQKDVEHFYRDKISGQPVQDEIIAKYQKRFERYRNSVFCFLGADGIPWNNNAAERALRHLAVQRKISGAFSRKGANHYLRLLAVAQTCRFQNKSFLCFLTTSTTRDAGVGSPSNWIGQLKVESGALLVQSRVAPESEEINPSIVLFFRSLNGGMVSNSPRDKDCTGNNYSE
jgi:hypothetical protein